MFWVLSILFPRLLMYSCPCCLLISLFSPLLLFFPLYFPSVALSQCPPLSIYCYCDLISLSLCSTSAAPSITHMQTHTHWAIQSLSSEDKGGSVIDRKKCVSYIFLHIFFYTFIFFSNFLCTIDCVHQCVFTFMWGNTGGVFRLLINKHTYTESVLLDG